MRFASPGWLLLLIPAAALLLGYVIIQLHRKRYVARFTNVELLASVAPRRPRVAAPPDLRPAVRRAHAAHSG